jgi:hypothetical protein
LDGRVEAEIAASPLDIRARLVCIVEMMEAAGPQRMREPYVKPLRDGPWEMRMNGHCLSLKIDACSGKPHAWR